MKRAIIAAALLIATSPALAEPACDFVKGVGCIGAPLSYEAAIAGAIPASTSSTTSTTSTPKVVTDPELLRALNAPTPEERGQTIALAIGGGLALALLAAALSGVPGARRYVTTLGSAAWDFLKGGGVLLLGLLAVAGGALIVVLFLALLISIGISIFAAPPLFVGIGIAAWCVLRAMDDQQRQTNERLERIARAAERRYGDDDDLDL